MAQAFSIIAMEGVAQALDHPVHRSLLSYSYLERSIVRHGGGSYFYPNESSFFFGFKEEEKDREEYARPIL